jgi:hypothetical protein
VTADAEKIFELQRMPQMSVEILRSAVSRTRHRKAAGPLPRLEVRLVLARIDPRRLSAYRAVCGYSGDIRFPMLYPQALATPLHLHLMTRREFPFPPGRLIHVANEVEQLRPLDAGESLGLCARLGSARKTARGMQFDIVTECSDAKGNIPWRSSMTLLSPHPWSSFEAESHPEERTIGLARYLPLDVHADVGRRYAKAAGDFHPIHLSRPTARLFGLSRPVAHDMWLAAYCMAHLPAPRTGWRHCRLQFLRALELPARTVLRFCDNRATSEFTLLNADGVSILDGYLA